MNSKKQHSVISSKMIKLPLTTDEAVKAAALKEYISICSKNGTTPEAVKQALLNFNRGKTNASVQFFGSKNKALGQINFEFIQGTNPVTEKKPVVANKPTGNATVPVKPANQAKTPSPATQSKKACFPTKDDYPNFSVKELELIKDL